ncbi:disulfide bond formation protein B [Terasakiella sp. A23]|uniref:disulfide bond formation protein B n=1 Tax=Terasakiella sp. FCG-A23 TaxID=3080561 RepID=UPI00295443FD|nr:disulfide bond formation protein B [Terasakiella sp. A23]MDV7340059.1 disulfide bond formation protein B [Terasakiella sp. A23]
MTYLIERISQNPKLPGLFIFLVCLGGLSTAYFVQYVVGIEPCVLCLYQRIPYVASGLFALFAIIGKPGSFTQQAALAGCGISFMIGGSIAFYHFGVEEGYWQAACSGAQSMNMSFEDLKASIMAEPVKACDTKDWVMLGISITVYNTIGSLFLAASSFTSLSIIRKLKANT